MDDGTIAIIQEILTGVGKEDPASRKWHVPKLKTVVVWCDASIIAMHVVIEIDGVVVEDAAWL